MGETTEIGWTDASVNFWWGCTKVGPGCDHCYAETFDKRVGGAHWGVGAPRRKIASASNLIRRLNGKCAQGAPHKRVFIQSMSDLFDLDVPIEWFREAWEEIEGCSFLEIQVVTKRISVVERRLRAIGRATWPAHVGLIVTVVDQDEADRDIRRLISAKHRLRIPWVGLSIEPLLGPIDLEYPQSLWPNGPQMGCDGSACGCMGLPVDAPMIHGINWVICGAESGHHARPMETKWAENIAAQCKTAGVPFFMKQLPGPNGRTIKDLALFPEDLRVRQFPNLR